MATFNKINAFSENLAEAADDLGTAALTLAFTNTAHTAGMANISNLTLVPTTNLDSVLLVTTSSSQTDGVYTLVMENKTVTSSGDDTGPFQYVYIYVAATGNLVGYYNMGSAQTILDGQSMDINFTDAQVLLTINLAA